MSSPVQKQPRRARGRPRAFDADAALVRATQTFWRRGFAGTSLDELENAMDLNRPSLYGAFGDKRELYLAALDRYVTVSHAAMVEALGADVPLADALQSVYERALALYFADAQAPLGCFLIGTAATEAARDAGVRTKLGAGLRQLTKAFEARFRAEGRRDAAFLADLAAAVLFSIALRARAGDSRASLRRFSREAVAFLCGSAARR
jgi:AcrR family transcriptional regulator